MLGVAIVSSRCDDRPIAFSFWDDRPSEFSFWTDRPRVSNRGEDCPRPFILLDDLEYRFVEGFLSWVLVLEVAFPSSLLSSVKTESSSSYMFNNS